MPKSAIPRSDNERVGSTGRTRRRAMKTPVKAMRMGSLTGAESAGPIRCHLSQKMIEVRP